VLKERITRFIDSSGSTSDSEAAAVARNRGELGIGGGVVLGGVSRIFNTALRFLLVRWAESVSRLEGRLSRPDRLAPSIPHRRRLFEMSSLFSA
jgi:hypothetical protein